MGAARRDTNIRTEEDAGTIEFTVLKNDKTLENMRLLIELKNVIAKQLPRMPRPYIVRLIMDRVHEAMVILKRRPNGKSYVLGGCVFRPFY
jgi:histone acetyltransferase